LTAPTAKLFPRFAADRVTTALKDTPVVMVNGPRQGGKTTLVREFVSRDRTYITGRPQADGVQERASALAVPPVPADKDSPLEFSRGGLDGHYTSETQ